MNMIFVSAAETLGSVLLTLFIIFGVPLVIFLSIFIPVRIIRKKYRNFVLTHSVGIKKLDEINKKYRFNKIPNFDMSHSYDNENFYDDISCEDYLTYQLVFLQRKVNDAMKATLENKNLYPLYEKEIEDTVRLEQYDTDELLRNRRRLKRTEKKIFEEKFVEPTTEFSISVKLTLTRINGDKRRSKKETFSPKDIKDIIFRLNRKKGSYYADEQIWQSICRVERGKVTNKMRFAIYQRDGYRCQICGRKRNDLEVDHIYPIAKGGKSTFDNLQTLCHRCNVRKGANVDY